MSPAVRRATILAALLVGLVPANSASAHHPEEYTIPGETMATDGLLYAAVDRADAWHASLGSTPPPARIYMMDDDEALARGDLESGKLWFDREFMRGIRGLIASRERRARLDGYLLIFYVSAHERGHNLGWGHDAGGIMTPTSYPLSMVPAAGWDWAMQMVGPGARSAKSRKGRAMAAKVTRWTKHR